MEGIPMRSAGISTSDRERTGIRDERAVEAAVMGWLPCDRDGVTEDEEGMVPDDATVAYISTLDGSREERAFNLAKHDYYGFLDYKEDRYTTVYGYMD